MFTMEDVPQPHNYTHPKSRVRKKKVLNYVMNCAEIQKIVHILNMIQALTSFVICILLA